MVGKNVKRLLYRGTRDGFASSAFHSFCDGKANTIIIIKNELNHVFGGYISVAWHSSHSHSFDSSAYLFSLRRDNSSNSEKYLIINPEYAVYGEGWNGQSYGPTFGRNHDISVCPNNPNINKCRGGFKSSYNTPSSNYLAGASYWLVIEIEVYQLE